MKQIYNVGIYCRLSVDDASNTAKARNYIPADESTSIENQRDLLSKFAMLNGWVETRTYIDDGYSGGNFQRPGFLEMLEDARKGIINLILVKDDCVIKARTPQTLENRHFLRIGTEFRAIQRPQRAAYHIETS